jgi:hypothetical protein
MPAQVPAPKISSAAAHRAAERDCDKHPGYRDHCAGSFRNKTTPF